MSRMIAPLLTLLALMALGTACGKVIEVAPPPADSSGASDASVQTDTTGPADTGPETAGSEDLVVGHDGPPPDVLIVCDEPQELLCNGACALCPSEAGVTEHACFQGDCVAVACAPGFHLCEGTCCRWNVSSPDQSGFTGRHIKIAVDEDQRTHLVFHWEFASPPMPGIRWLVSSETGWQKEDVTTGGIAYLDFVLDQAQSPQIVHNGAGAGLGGFAVVYQDADGGGWPETFWPSATVNPIKVMSARIAVDGQGYPHVLFRDEGRGVGELKHAVLNFQSEFDPWQTDIVEGNVAAGLPAHSESLAVDSAARIHVAYVNEVSNRLIYAMRGPTADAWAQETLFEGLAVSPSLALDTASRPQVAFVAPNRGELVFAHWDGEWRSEIITEARSEQIVLAVGPNDQPHLAYVNQREGGRLEYARRTLLGWRFSVVDEGTEIDGLDLALDADGNPRIAYHDVGRDRAMLALW